MRMVLVNMTCPSRARFKISKALLVSSIESRAKLRRLLFVDGEHERTLLTIHAFEHAPSFGRTPKCIDARPSRSTRSSTALPILPDDAWHAILQQFAHGIAGRRALSCVCKELHGLCASDCCVTVPEFVSVSDLAWASRRPFTRLRDSGVMFDMAAFALRDLRIHDFVNMDARLLLMIGLMRAGDRLWLSSMQGLFDACRSLPLEHVVSMLCDMRVPLYGVLLAIGCLSINPHTAFASRLLPRMHMDAALDAVAVAAYARHLLVSRLLAEVCGS